MPKWIFTISHVTSKPHVPVRIALFSALLIALVIGCSKSPEPAAATAPENSYDTAAATVVQIDPLTAVVANETTHLAAGKAGIFFDQETDDGTDTVFQINQLDSAETTTLTAQSVGLAMGQKNVTGNFQGLAVAGDWLYFYFTGSADRASLCCVGRWNSQGQIEILANNQQLIDTTGTGDTLSICRGEMAQSDGIVWLWLHSINGSYFLQIDSTLAQTRPTVESRFKNLTIDYQPPDFTHDNYSVGAGPNQTLLIIDSWLGALWRVRPDGIIKQIHLLTGLPKEMSSPALDDQNRIIIFATGSDLIPPRVDSQAPEPMDYTEYPAFLIFTDEKITAYPRKMLKTQPPYDIDKLTIKNLCPVPDKTGWIAYDPNAGELFRIHLTHQ
jgi:hypothetical protein